MTPCEHEFDLLRQCRKCGLGMAKVNSSLGLPTGDNRIEDRYEAFEIIIKAREDGVSWFDIFTDMITETCQGTTEPDEDGNYEGCTCGMESAGGMTGTLDQCYRWTMPDISDEEWERDWSSSEDDELE